MTTLDASIVLDASDVTITATRFSCTSLNSAGAKSPLITHNKLEIRVMQPVELMVPTTSTAINSRCGIEPNVRPNGRTEDRSGTAEFVIGNPFLGPMFLPLSKPIYLPSGNPMLRYDPWFSGKGNRNVCQQIEVAYSEPKAWWLDEVLTNLFLPLIQLHYHPSNSTTIKGGDVGPTRSRQWSWRL
jgi:hypothetical protein